MKRGFRAMCEKCIEIDKRIERYRRILRLISDQITIEQSKELIAEFAGSKGYTSSRARTATSSRLVRSHSIFSIHRIKHGRARRGVRGPCGDRAGHVSRETRTR